MPNYKAIIDFTGYTAADLAPLAQSIHDAMTAAAVTFPDPPADATMPLLATSIATFHVKQAARATGASADMLAATVARHELESILASLGGYVNIVAKGDQVIIEASGIPSYSTSRTPDLSAPAAPADVRLRQGDLSGQIVSRYKPDRANSMNEAQTCTSDPNMEGNWHVAGMYSGGKATLGPFTPGTVIWVRHRTMGLKGIAGAWSDPAKIMVT